MTADEGYIKYVSDWTPGPDADPAAATELEAWRRPLHDAGLVGYYADLGIGFGNISIRGNAARQFIISGTQTGHLQTTNGSHYALVTDYDIEKNRVSSTGPVEASSESLTHAAIYELDAAINGVVHVHSKLLWSALLNQIPTTDASVAYGTPEMAREFARLCHETDFAETGIAVMAGHEEGIISIGASLQEAAMRVLRISQPGD
ncbi:MAG: class II aldolase/adducin family protein [Gammaproteobacteria bacterium]|nr:class II aldolase/adducin family protein [Gammaproteobacteria bacterium]